MSPTDRDHLVENIVWHLSQGVERFIQERAITEYWGKVDSGLGARVARGSGDHGSAADGENRFY